MVNGAISGVLVLAHVKNKPRELGREAGKQSLSIVSAFVFGGQGTYVLYTLLIVGYSGRQSQHQ